MTARKEDILVHLAGEGLPNFFRTLGYDVKKKGREYVMLCPFHDDTRPSFAIVPSNGFCGCPACDMGGDVFHIIKHLRGFKDFKEVLAFVAEKLGLDSGGKVNQGRVLEIERISKAAASTIMTSAEVHAELKILRAAAEDPAPYLSALYPAVEPEIAATALAQVGGFVAKIRRDKQETGCWRPDKTGFPVLVVPMRTGAGALCSLRFRSLGPKRPGERTPRWTLDVLDPKTGEQVKGTDSGFMAPTWVFEAPPMEGQYAMLIEGETDLIGGICMMVPYGTSQGDDGPGWEEWPARWIGLPGVGALHDQLTPELLGRLAWTFTDADWAGRNAVFDHYRMRCTTCGRVTTRDVCNHRAGPGEPVCGGTPKRDRSAVVEGLLTKLKTAGVRALASFPPVLVEGQKPDLRDVVNAGWDWRRLEAHLVATGTGRRRAG